MRTFLMITFFAFLVVATISNPIYKLIYKHKVIFISIWIISSIISGGAYGMVFYNGLIEECKSVAILICTLGLFISEAFIGSVLLGALIKFIKKNIKIRKE